MVPDPFFIEYLAILGMNDPGFAGMSALDAAILKKSFDEVKSLLPSYQMSQNCNFLGQTPLHLAASDLRISSMLVDAGHDINATDRRGITPLMYSAAMDSRDVVELLISNGADLIIHDCHLNRDFFAYAAARGNWNLIFESLENIRTFYGHNTAQHFVITAMMCLLPNYPFMDDLRTSYFEDLVGLCEDVNFTFKDGITGAENNNLLHYVQNWQEAQALVRHGFQGFNEPNSEGELAIFSIACNPQAELIQFCLENGTQASHIDNQGRTILMKLLVQLKEIRSSVWDIIDSVKLILAGDTDIFIPDNCRCACSQDGCSTFSVFNLAFDMKLFSNAPKLIWAFEWLSLVEEFRGYQTSKLVLLSFLRRTQFDLLDITHVCCHRGRGMTSKSPLEFMRPKSLQDEDIEEILDEECELIEELEKIQRLWVSSSLEALRSHWMILLKRQFDERSVDAARQMEEKKRNPPSMRPSGRQVDYKNDAYYFHVSCDRPIQVPSDILSSSMAEYAFWLQHNLTRSRNNISSMYFKEGWYERRLSWFIDLMNVMQIPKDAIIKKMQRIDITESRAEMVDQISIVENFSMSLNSLKTNSVGE
ncbi:hypothetical protein N7462_004779 [Penicillium macrosclerotiorum]|uniref:uncharacterized protein n=1 Tax=Penicillium macrosclerotiorum TaxID=303699 RepID=UPI002547B31E|nr:uncharacterized protein N7462_004779 [Penicillium macrosclerotiorum]KAJ5690387.1 hypothetical protein N7462_004779 [Penicillium macrosclerotiorum]